MVVMRELRSNDEGITNQMTKKKWLMLNAETEQPTS